MGIHEFVPGETGLFQAIINNIGQIWVGLYPSAYTIISLVILIRWRRTIDRESPLDGFYQSSNFNHITLYYRHIPWCIPRFSV